jgi:cell division protein FtsQ
MKRQVTGRFKIGGRRNRRTSSRITPISKAARAGTSSLIKSIINSVPYLIGIAAFAGGVIGVHYGWEALTNSARLAIRTVEITGNERVRREEVAAYTGIQVGDPILRADLDQAALLLRRHPWVRAAHVQRRLPDRVQVSITENAPAIVLALGELYLANKDGQVFKRLTVEDRVVLPVVTGLGREELADAPELGTARTRVAIELGAAVQADAATFGRLEELHWDRDLGWSIVTQPSATRASGMRLHLGLDPLPRVKTASAALARLKQDNLEPEVLWADGLKNPSRVQARLRNQATDRDTTFIAKAR